jgi:DNA mismatch repair protein MutH
VNRNKYKYDKNSPQSILEYALKLSGKSLSEATQLPEGITNSRNRGDLGSLVEKYFFEHVPPNDHEPDFKEAGVELKTTGVILKSSSYQAKERLVLTMINYESLVNENWEESTLKKKCQLMLILFYLYSKDVSVVDRKFVKILLYSIPDSDITQIKRDWEAIKQSVLDGKAHELSEGDTFYLGACRKGSGGEKESLRSQPYSTEPAKSRAFSFKQSYLNKILEGLNENKRDIGLSKTLTIAEATQLRFDPFIGKSVEEISKELNYFKKSLTNKGFLKDISNRILSGGDEVLIELEKAGIELKTIRLNKSGKPRESMSFPGFKYLEIINEEWEDSSFFEKIERKFLLIIFQTDEKGSEKLLKAVYWNMPYEDRLEAKRVWEETKRRVAVDSTRLPGITESKVAHVRPKARNGSDKILTPQGDMQIKKCFWLNSSYIAKVISSL